MGAIDVPTGLDPTQNTRLEDATATTQETFALSSFLLISFSFVVLCFALRYLPWTCFRIQLHGSAGWSLSSSPAPIRRTPRSIFGGHKHNDDRELDVAAQIASSLPKRSGHLPFAALSTIVIPRLEISVPQATLLVIAIVFVTIASFSGSNYLTDSTRTGYVAITLVPCVIALGNKVFGVGTILQVGYASVNWAHRWLGRILFFVTTLHVIAYLTIFSQTHTMKSEMSKSANVLASIGYSGFCLIFFSSIGYVRRHWWHLFKICHHFGIFLFVVGLNYHSRILRPWVAVCVTLIGLSALFRVLTSRLHIAYVTALPNSKSTIIHFPSVRSGWIPGQSVRIRVLTGGMGLDTIWESHPFTLASAPTSSSSDSENQEIEGGAKLVVKSAGDWTNKLFQIASKAERRGGDAETPIMARGKGIPVAILIEGPYGGSNVVYSAYGSVLLAAGGSGVSFALGVASGIITASQERRTSTRNLYIVWTVRDRAAINDLLPEFEDLLASARSCPELRVTITLYFTSVSRGLIVRPFSAMPTSVTLVHQLPRIPRSARASTTIASTPQPHRGVAPPPAYTPSPLRKNFMATPDPNSSTAALLGSTAQSSSGMDLDVKTGLASPPQFIISAGGDDKGEDPDDASEGSITESDVEAEIVTNYAFAKKALAQWKEGEDPFSDIYAPPPPSPSTKPVLRKRSPMLSVDLKLDPIPTNLETSPPIELKPGRPEYNNILQEIIEREHAYARVHNAHFEEKFAALNNASVTSAGLAGAGRIAVGACGPAGMVASLRSMCFDADGVDFHAEQFSL